MPTKVLVTALPNGIVRNRTVKLSALLSPQLSASTAESTLSSFVFDGWATKARELAFDVSFGGTTVSAEAAEGAPEPREDLWAALFPGDTFVRAYEVTDISKTTLKSYPAANVAKFTEDAYVNLAATAIDGPLLADVLAQKDFFGKIAAVEKLDDGKVGRLKPTATRTSINDALKQSTSTKFDLRALPRAAPDPPSDFVQAESYFDVRSRGRVNPGVPGRGGPDPRIDFHQMVALLGHHPHLMRLLGLAFDLYVDVPEGLIGTVKIAVQPRWPSGLGSSPAFVSLRTRTKLTGFLAQPKPPPTNPSSSTPTQSELSKGMLNLANEYPDGGSVFEMLDIDTDAAALKLRSFADNVTRTVAILGRLQKDEAPEVRSTRALRPPALRSPGMSLIRSGRADKVKSLMAAGLSLLQKATAPDPAAVDLYADDLVRGYAIDVYDEAAGRWFPLCRRSGTALFGDAELEVPIQPEDGWVSLGATKAPPGSTETGKNDLYVHEALFRWTNWSLVAQRPGKTVDESERARAVSNTAETDFKLQVSFEVPADADGALPILRYGRSYRIRARVVDLAGNSTPFGDPTAKQFALTIGPGTFARLEPVPAPVLLMRKPRTEAESVEHMVIRSNYDTPPASTSTNERHVAPPKIDLFHAELHGMFDTPTGVDPNSYDMIAAREDGSFDESDPTTHALVHTQAKRDPANYDQPYYDVDELRFNVENGTTSQLPYLPDPLSKGAVFQNLPGGSPDEKFLASFTEEGGAQLEWPERAPFRIRLREGDASRAFENGILDVRLPKGEVVEVDYASFHEPSDLASFRLMRWVARATARSLDASATTRSFMGWMRGAARASSSDAVKAERDTLAYMERVARSVRAGRFRPRNEHERRLMRMVDGTHPMTMPERKLVLVHAIRQPLTAPVITKMEPKRKIGWSYAKLGYALDLHESSTDEVDIHASWTDIYDVIEGSAWLPEKMTPVDQFVFKHVVAHVDVRGLPVLPKHEFGDTKHRVVTYRGTALSRFTEYFTERTTVRFFSSTGSVTVTPSPALLGEKGIVVGSEVLKSLDGTTTYDRGVDYSVDNDLGTLTRMASGSIPVNTDLSLQFVAPPVTRQTAEGVEVSMPSSARPAAPRVLYTIPTFAWSRAATDESVTSDRTGRGLRIYLDRPWWSSGVGEQLALVMRPTGKLVLTKTLERLAPFITRWGLDPLWRSTPTSDLPTVDDVETTSSRAPSSYSIEELDGVKVEVAAHDVGFDEDRRLWYCDVSFKTPAYFPFIRLALARFQADSIEGAHLSRIVLADIVQLTPDRSLTVTFDPADERGVNVSLSGRSYTSSDVGAGPAEVQISVEERRPGIENPAEELGWTPVDGSVEVLSGSFPRGAAFAVWSGRVELPVARGDQRLRLVIREYEKIRTAEGGGRGTVGRRLVYVETVELSGPENPAPKPDLTISATTATSFTVRNIGQGPASAFSVTVEGPAGVPPIEFDFPSGLAAGQEAIRQITSSTESRTVTVDPANEVSETNENNNVGTIPAAELPDLHIPLTGHTSVTVRNIGAGDAGPFELAIIDANGDVEQSFSYAGLAAGAQFVQTISGSTQARTAFVDPSNQVQETNENNNTLPIAAMNTTTTTTTTMPPTTTTTAPLPDLVVNASTSNSFTVRNNGPGAAPASQAQVRFTSSGSVQSTHSIPALASGVSHTVTIGTSSLNRTAVADSANQVTESNEGNNTRAIPNVPA